MTTKLEHTWLFVFAGFTSITAVIGGLSVVATNGLGMPLSWLGATPFQDYTIPGVMLLVIVGGSALIAALFLHFHHRWQYVIAFGSGAILVGWIMGEALLIQQTSWLQALYLVVGLLQMGLALLATLQATREWKHRQDRPREVSHGS